MAEPSRRPTQRDVARRAGVSTATVSYVLSGRRGSGKPPGPATTERVLQAAADIGYERDQIARSLRRQRSDVVALIYPAPSSPWSDRLAEQLQAAASERGLTVIALPIGATTPPGTVWRPLREGYVDGAVVLPDCPLEDTDLRVLASRGVSLVVFDDELAPDGFDVVRQGRLAACRAAVERLVALDHRRIAYLAQPHERPGAARSVRLRGYREVMDAHGLAIEPELVQPVADSRSDAYAAVQTMLSQPLPPTALFSATDRAAIDSIWAARDRGVRVPQDLAVIGVGNIPEGMMISPPLTTIGAPAFDFTAPVQRLFARLDSANRMDGEVLEEPWSLIERGSA